jgi:hypothetical protein
MCVFRGELSFHFFFFEKKSDSAPFTSPPKAAQVYGSRAAGEGGVHHSFALLCLTLRFVFPRATPFFLQTKSAIAGAKSATRKKQSATHSAQHK